MGTDIERNAHGLPLQTTLPSGSTFSQTYDQQGNLRTFTDDTVNGTTTFTYDPDFNTVTSIRDPYGETTRFSYDSQGNLTRLTSPLGRQTTMDYNSQGLLTTMTDTLGTTSSFTYNGQGNLTQMQQGIGVGSRTTALAFTPAGYVQAITDTIGQQVHFSYDSFGRVLSETLPGNRTIVYGYDNGGNLTSLTPPSQPTHSFAHNELGLVETYTAPAVTGGGSNQTSYDYNNSQQVELVTRPDGLTLDFVYDGGGRLDNLLIPRGTVGYDYNSSTGQLESVTAPGGVTLTYGYDGELLNNVSWSGPVTGSVGFQYDANYNIIEDSVNGIPISYAYDADGSLTRAGVLSYTYDSNSGLPISSTLSHVTDQWQFSSFSEPIAYSAAVSGTTVYDVQYGRDDLGRIISKTETISGTTTTFDYAYDTSGRLHQVHENNSLMQTYTYDDNGNRLSYTNAVSSTINGSYDDQDRLLTYGGLSYTYTPNGELLTKADGGQTTDYDYDVLGNLMGVSLPSGMQITYEVDGENRRIGKRINGTFVQSFLYQDALNPIAELDGSGTVVSRFVYGNRINVPEYMEKNGITYRIIADHLGSVRLVIDTQSGTIAQRLDYDAFGNVLTDTNPGFQPFGYAGGIYDTDTGFTRFGARDYDPISGRWTAKDPVGFDGGDTNLYAYVGNDPINRLDPTGEFVVVLGFVVVAGIITSLTIREFQKQRSRLGEIKIGSNLDNAAVNSYASNYFKTAKGGGNIGKEAFEQIYSPLDKLRAFPGKIGEAFSVRKGASNINNVIEELVNWSLFNEKNEVDCLNSLAPDEKTPSSPICKVDKDGNYVCNWP